MTYPLRDALWAAGEHAHRAQRRVHDLEGVETREGPYGGHPGSFADCPAPVCAERRMLARDPRPLEGTALPDTEVIVPEYEEVETPLLDKIRYFPITWERNDEGGLTAVPASPLDGR